MPWWTVGDMSVFNKKKDYCTGVPDFGFGTCCMIHDEDYAIGGNRVDRKFADSRFRQCMKNTGEYKVIVKLYYLGVRAVGWLPCFWNGRGLVYDVYRKVKKAGKK